LQEAVDQCHGRAAVYVVVAIDHDAFLASHGVVQSVNGNVHVVHQERVYELAQQGPEKTLGGRLGAYAAPYEQAGHHRTGVQLLGQLFSLLLSLG